MAKRAPKVCARIGCEALTTGKHCGPHALEVRSMLRARRATREKERPSRHERGYGSEWVKIRRRQLERFPRCRRCTGKATQVDHITPKRLGGTDATANLQSLCDWCHRRKTAEDARAIRKAAAHAARRV